jgi:prolipoprotein diacylglyceryltransferase
VPLAVITFEFDPLLHLGDWSVRWETVAIGAAILVGLVAAGLLAPRTRFPVDGAESPDAPDVLDHIRPDDVLFVALGVVPGAVIGGRLAYVALHLDYYSANTGAIVDPGSGGLALSGAVVLGALSGGIVAHLFEAPVGRWFGLAVAPMLLVLGLGKAANVLGGTGQGLPASTDWATRYLGPGPWGSLGPDVPSHPAQVYEAVGVAAVLAIVVVARRLGVVRAPDGRAFVIALGGWAAVRLAVATVWRDPVVVGPFKAEQLIDLAIVGLAVVVYVGLAVRARRAPRPVVVGDPAAPGLSWPDPETRRRF